MITGKNKKALEANLTRLISLGKPQIVIEKLLTEDLRNLNYNDWKDNLENEYKLLEDNSAYNSFEDYLNETKIVQEFVAEVIDEETNEVITAEQQEITELIRIYTPDSEETLKSDIDSYLLETGYLLQAYNLDYENSVKELTDGCSEAERSTWVKQEIEARAFLADDTVETPFIDSLATARGVDKSYLVLKIIEKADAFAIALGRLTGLRQKMEDLLKKK